MASEARHVGAFRIDGDLDNLQLVLLSDAGDELIRYRLTPEMVCKLAVEIPQYANQMANSVSLDGFANSKDWRKKLETIKNTSTQRE